MKVIKNVVHKFGKWYCAEICRREYKKQEFNRKSERAIEYRFLFQQLVKTCPKTVLDVGTGTSALPQVIKDCGYVVTAIDNVYDYWPKGMFNRHFYVVNVDIVRTKIKERFDLISCVSVLEHIERHDDAFESMFSLLNPGGHLIFTFPYNENTYVENIYKHQDAGYGSDLPYICHVFSRKEVNNWLNRNGGKVCEQEYWRFFDGELWTFGEQLTPPIQVDKDEKHQLTCIIIRKDSDKHV